MDPTVQVELIKQSSALAQAIIWPAAALLVIFKFKGGMGEFFRRVSELNLKTPAGEFSAKAAQATALLGAAQTAKQSTDDASSGQESTAAVREVPTRVEAAIRAGARLRGRRVLWVDDNPGNNRYESEAFRTLGIEVVTARDTDDAVRELQRSRYDAAITDLTRGSNARAGLEFIALARDAHPRLPIFVYSSRKGQSQYAEAAKLGAAGTTFQPNELFDLVTRRLSHGQD